MFCLVLDKKFWQKSPINVGVPQNSILGLTLLLFCKDDLPDDAITNFTFYADDTTLNSKYDCASDFVGNKAKGRITRKQSMPNFPKKEHFLPMFSCYLRLEIHLFALLPTGYSDRLHNFFCHHSFMLKGFTLPVIVLVQLDSGILCLQNIFF